jgi:hypothetical protein
LLASLDCILARIVCANIGKRISSKKSRIISITVDSDCRNGPNANVLGLKTSIELFLYAKGAVGALSDGLPIHAKLISTGFSTK